MAISLPFQMPPDSAPDVAKRTFKFTADDGPVQSVDCPAAGFAGTIKVAPGSAVVGWATFADAAGNESAPGPSASVVAVDATAPPAPGAAPTFGTGDTVPD